MDWGIEQMNEVGAVFQQKTKRVGIKRTKFCFEKHASRAIEDLTTEKNVKTNHFMLPSQKLYHN
jgi:hypothetical protein